MLSQSHRYLTEDYHYYLPHENDSRSQKILTKSEISTHTSQYFPTTKKTEQLSSDNKKNPFSHTIPTYSRKQSQPKSKSLGISQFISNSSSKIDESETVSIVALQFSPSLSLATTCISSDSSDVTIQDENSSTNQDSINDEIDQSLELPLLNERENEEYETKHSQIPCQFITVPSKIIGPRRPFQKRISTSNNTKSFSYITSYTKLNPNVKKESDGSDEIAEIGYLMHSSVTCAEKENIDLRLERYQSLLSIQKPAETLKCFPHKSRNKDIPSIEKESADMQTSYNMDTLNGQQLFIQSSSPRRFPKIFGANKKTVSSQKNSMILDPLSIDLLENELGPRNNLETIFHSSSQYEKDPEALRNKKKIPFIFSNLVSMNMKPSMDKKSIRISPKGKIKMHLKRSKKDSVPSFTNSNFGEGTNFLSEESKIESPYSDFMKPYDTKKYDTAESHNNIQVKRDDIWTIPHKYESNDDIFHEFCQSKSMRSTQSKSKAQVESMQITTKSDFSSICSPERESFGITRTKTSTSSSSKPLQKSTQQKFNKDILFVDSNLNDFTQKTSRKQQTKKVWTIKPLADPKQRSVSEHLNGFKITQSSQGTGLKNDQINIKDIAFDMTPNYPTYECDDITYDTDDSESISNSSEQHKVIQIKNSLLNKTKQLTNKSKNLAKKISNMKTQHNTSLKKLTQIMRKPNKTKKEFSTSAQDVIADFHTEPAKYMENALLLPQLKSNKITRTRNKYRSKESKSLLPTEGNNNILSPNVRACQRSKTIWSTSRCKTQRSKTKQKMDEANLESTKKKTTIKDKVLDARNKMKSMTSSASQLNKPIHLPHFQRQRGKSFYFV